MSYRRHIIVRLETRPVILEVLKRSAFFSSILKGLVVRLSAIALIRFKWKHLAAVFTIACDMTHADSFRSCRRPLQILWKPSLKPSFHMSGKSQTIGDFVVSQPSQILPTYLKIAKRLSQINGKCAKPTARQTLKLAI